jgi:hypothetical protein
MIIFADIYLANMKKLFFSSIIALVLFAACSDDTSSINGMWQLKTIQDTNGNIQSIDTVYYGFQHEEIFSYTILHERKDKPATAQIIYGYSDFPAEKQLHLQVDKKGDINVKIKFLTLWNNEPEITYDILQLEAKKLTLSHEGAVYHFIKY